MNTNAEDGGFRFVFPEVLRKLDYAWKLGRQDREPVGLPDARETVRWYFREMTGGVAYERCLNEAWNTSQPHVLTRQNFANAANVHARGWRYSTLPPVLDIPLPALQQLPPSADLFESDQHDEAVGTLIDVLNGQPGFLIANSCKIFYQKRPRLVPVLDSFFRQVVNLPWGRDDEDVITPALRTIRRVADYGPNRRTLDNLQDWADTDPAAVDGLPLSRLRLLDILAWGVIRRRTG